MQHVEAANGTSTFDGSSTSALAGAVAQSQSALLTTRCNARPLDVLVVEDDPATLRAVELALGHQGHLVVSARSLEAASALLSSFIFDAVLCDVRLPDGLATDLLPDIRACTSPVAVVAMSADPITLDGSSVRRSFDYRLPKPIDFAELERTLRRLCLLSDMQ